jgi:hypothetical protein
MRLLTARLERLAPEATPDADLKYAASVLAVFGVDPARAEDALRLLIPLALTLILEAGSIVFGGMALAKPNVRRTVRQPETPAITGHRTVLPNRSANIPNRSIRPSKTVRKTVLEAEQDLVTMLAMNRSIPSQQALAERWGVAKSTVSVWLKDWDARGLTARHTDGRRKAVTGAT